MQQPKQQNVVKLTNLPPAIAEAKRSLAKACSPSQAADVAGVIVGSYPQKHLTNPEVYMTQITILLGEYPLSIVKDVAHPYSGIVGKCKFLPSVAEIKEVAEQKLAELRGVIWAHEREQRRLAEARAEAEFEARLPSLEERERAAAEAQKVIEKLRLKSVADALK